MARDENAAARLLKDRIHVAPASSSSKAASLSTSTSKKRQDGAGQGAADEDPAQKMERISRTVITAFMDAVADRKTSTLTHLRQHNPDIQRVMRETQLNSKSVTAILQTSPDLFVRQDGTGTVYIALNPQRIRGENGGASSSRPTSPNKKNRPVSASLLKKHKDSQQRSGADGRRSLFSDDGQEKNDGSESDSEEEISIVTGSQAPSSRPKAMPRHSMPAVSTSETLKHKDRHSNVTKQGKRHSLPGGREKLPGPAEMQERDRVESLRRKGKGRGDEIDLTGDDHDDEDDNGKSQDGSWLGMTEAERKQKHKIKHPITARKHGSIRPSASSSVTSRMQIPPDSSESGDEQEDREEEELLKRKEEERRRKIAEDAEEVDELEEDEDFILPPPLGASIATESIPESAPRMAPDRETPDPSLVDEDLSITGADTGDTDMADISNLPQGEPPAPTSRPTADEYPDNSAFAHTSAEISQLQTTESDENEEMQMDTTKETSRPEAARMLDPTAATPASSSTFFGAGLTSSMVRAVKSAIGRADKLVNGGDEEETPHHEQQSEADEDGVGAAEAETARSTPFPKSRRRSQRPTHSRGRSTISSVGSKGKGRDRTGSDDNADETMDLENGSAAGLSSVDDAAEGMTLTSSAARKDKDQSATLLDPYQAARQGTVGPSSERFRDEAAQAIDHSTRESSMNVEDSAEEIEGAMNAHAQASAGITKPVSAGSDRGSSGRNPEREARRRRVRDDDEGVLQSSRATQSQSQGVSTLSKSAKATSATKKPVLRGPDGELLDDEDTDEDVVYVSAVPSGSEPAKPRKTKEERQAERDERERKRQERRLRRKRRKKPVPSFKKPLEIEHEELDAAYLARASLLKEEYGIPQEGEWNEDLVRQWKLFKSFESPKKHNDRRMDKPDFNTVKFWPYNLPFPGRKKDEAIVAVAGGCQIRVFRLSETRGVSELWNALDESLNWDREDERENFLSLVWTYETRQQTRSSTSPYWRKWPLLCAAGEGREVKILDGYTGTTVKVVQGHGGTITSMAVHSQLPHIIATASKDEAIALWDISVPISMPETIMAKYKDAHHEGKRWKGYAAGERLATFGGFGGHVEAVLSTSFHPCLPFLLSGGADCKLRIWRLPPDLPQQPASSLMTPSAIPPPESSRRPPSYAFPCYTNLSLHSHHIDHVSWIGSSGMILTRTLCYDSPGRRVIRVFKPRFFDTLETAQVPDVIGLDTIEYPSDVELFGRWTVAACSENIGDGVISVTNELSIDPDSQAIISHRHVYIPTTEPAIHVFPFDTKKKQEDLAELQQRYPITIGREVLKEALDSPHDGQMRAMDVQPGGSGWILAVGEMDKLTVWVKKGKTDIDAIERIVGNTLGMPVPGELETLAAETTQRIEPTDNLQQFNHSSSDVNGAFENDADITLPPPLESTPPAILPNSIDHHPTVNSPVLSDNEADGMQVDQLPVILKPSEHVSQAVSITQQDQEMERSPSVEYATW